jgi:hypothetical protein
MLALALAGLLVYSPATEPPPDDPDETIVNLAAPPEVSQRFLAWAEVQGTPVQLPACIQIAEAVTCYGLTGDMVTGYTGTVVAIDVLTDDVEDFVLMPFGVPADVAAPAATAATAAVTSFGDGTYRVGVDIQPGTYRTDGPEGGRQFCYWERLSGFSGETDDIIANGNEPGQAFLEVAASDVAVGSSGCTWTLLEQ